MNRIMLPNNGPVMSKIPAGIALGIRECKNVHVDVLTLVTPARNNLDSIVVGEFLGEAVSKKLMKGNQVPLGDHGIVLEHESVTTALKKRTLKVAVAFYISGNDVKKLDARPLDALIYVPWMAEDGVAWATKWDAETHGDQTQNSEIDLPGKVIEALKRLTISVNLSTGLSHPSDKTHAKQVFSGLAAGAFVWKPEEIEKWAVRNGWKPNDAEELAALSAKYLF